MRAAVAAGLALLALAAPASAQMTGVAVQFDAFGPGRVDVLPGESVRWENVSERTHTVTAEAFDSGELPPGSAFARAFDVAGTYGYGCTLHPTMTGEVRVSPVLLDPLPTQAIPVGDPVTFSGRTANRGEPVRIERNVDGEWETLATADPGPDGTWRASVAARASGEHRAASAAGASAPRSLLVSDRRVVVRRRRHVLVVTVTPPLPYGRILLQRDLRDRFGWWPAARARLDYRSTATFGLRGRAPARVLLLAEDRWTALATSRVIGARRDASPAPQAPPAHAHGS